MMRLTSTTCPLSATEPMRPRKMVPSSGGGGGLGLGLRFASPRATLRRARLVACASRRARRLPQLRHRAGRRAPRWHQRRLGHGRCRGRRRRTVAPRCPCSRRPGASDSVGRLDGLLGTGCTPSADSAIAAAGVRLARGRRRSPLRASAASFGRSQPSAAARRRGAAGAAPRRRAAARAARAPRAARTCRRRPWPCRTGRPRTHRR